MQNLWQAQNFRKVRRRLRDWRSTFGRTDFDFRKVKRTPNICAEAVSERIGIVREGFARVDLRGRRSFLARSGADLLAGAARFQGLAA